MAHLYSRGCEYALRALRVMAQSPGKLATVTQLCERARVPEHFTRKMLQPLVKAGILRSARGPGGGFRLTREAGEIALLDVVSAIESTPRFDLCILGNSQCDDSDPCPLHHIWAPIKDAVMDMLRGRTVADLVGDDVVGDDGNGCEPVGRKCAPPQPIRPVELLPRSPGPKAVRGRDPRGSRITIAGVDRAGL